MSVIFRSIPDRSTAGGQQHRDTFLYSLGGMSIGVEATFQNLLQHSDSAEERNFICPDDDGLHRIAGRDVSVQFASFNKELCHKPTNKIFSQELSDFYSTATGYLQSFYLTSAKKELAWTLAIDHQFSQFDYFIFSDRVQVIDPFKLAVRLFPLQHSFISCQGLIIHAAGGLVQGKGIIFAAPSGTGKSTLSRLLQCSSQNRLFSEERLIVRSLKDSWHVWGTPWHGEGHVARNESTPLSALFFLKQSKETRITQLAPSDGLHRLIQTASIPWYSEKWTNKGLAVCESLIQNTPMFELAFRPDQSVVQAVERFAVNL